MAEEADLKGALAFIKGYAGESMEERHFNNMKELVEENYGVKL